MTRPYREVWEPTPEEFAAWQQLHAQAQLDYRRIRAWIDADEERIKRQREDSDGH